MARAAALGLCAAVGCSAPAPAPVTEPMAPAVLVAPQTERGIVIYDQITEQEPAPELRWRDLATGATGGFDGLRRGRYVLPSLERGALWLSGIDDDGEQAPWRLARDPAGGVGAVRFSPYLYAVSPDGRQAVVRCDEGGGTCLARLEGDQAIGQRPILLDGVEAPLPLAWPRDGSIIFVDGEPGHDEVVQRFDPATGVVYPSGTVSQGAQSVSADGSTLLWADDIELADGSEPRTSRASWRPLGDGRAAPRSLEVPMYMASCRFLGDGPQRAVCRGFATESRRAVELIELGALSHRELASSVGGVDLPLSPDGEWIVISEELPAPRDAEPNHQLVAVSLSTDARIVLLGPDRYLGAYAWLP